MSEAFVNDPNGDNCLLIIDKNFVARQVAVNQYKTIMQGFLAALLISQNASLFQLV